MTYQDKKLFTTFDVARVLSHQINQSISDSFHFYRHINFEEKYAISAFLNNSWSAYFVSNATVMFDFNHEDRSKEILTDFGVNVSNGMIQTLLLRV